MLLEQHNCSLNISELTFNLYIYSHNNKLLSDSIPSGTIIDKSGTLKEI